MTKHKFTSSKGSFTLLVCSKQDCNIRKKFYSIKNCSIQQARTLTIPAIVQLIKREWCLCVHKILTRIILTQRKRKFNKQQQLWSRCSVILPLCWRIHNLMRFSYDSVIQWCISGVSLKIPTDRKIREVVNHMLWKNMSPVKLFWALQKQCGLFVSQNMEHYISLYIIHISLHTYKFSTLNSHIILSMDFNSM